MLEGTRPRGHTGYCYQNDMLYIIGLAFAQAVSQSELVPSLFDTDEQKAAAVMNDAETASGTMCTISRCVEKPGASWRRP